MWGPSKPGADSDGFRGSKTGRPKARPERPPRRPTTRSKALARHVFVPSRCLRFSFVSFFFVSSPSVRFFSVQRLDKIFCCVQRSDQKIPIRPLDVHLDPGPVLGRRGRRASTVDARPLASDRRRIQKPARHRSRSKNENFAQTDATHNYQVSFF